MFDKYIRQVNNDLAIESKRSYERRIAQLEEQLHKSATPEMLERANAIVEKFKETLVFKLVKCDENNLMNLIVWKDNVIGGVCISFEFNGRQFLVHLDKRDMAINNKLQDLTKLVIKEIGSKIAAAIAEDTIYAIVRAI